MNRPQQKKKKQQEKRLAKQRANELQKKLLFPFLPLSEVLRWLPVAQEERVGEGAATVGFLAAMIAARGGSEKIEKQWLDRRHDYLRRQMLLVTSNRESMFSSERNRPTRRHLSLILWGFSPQPLKLASLTVRASITTNARGEHLDGLAQP